MPDGENVSLEEYTKREIKRLYMENQKLKAMLSRMCSSMSREYGSDTCALAGDDIQEWWEANKE